MEKWIKSSYCAADKPQCVEIRMAPHGVEVRDSKWGGDSSVLHFSHDEWRAFTDGVKAGEFDLEAIAA